MQHAGYPVTAMFRNGEHNPSFVMLVECPVAATRTKISHKLQFTLVCAILNPQFFVNLGG